MIQALRTRSLPQQTIGPVVEVLPGSRYRVRTQGGTVEAAAAAGAAYRAGDEVLVRAGVIIGRARSERALPVYRV